MKNGLCSQLILLHLRPIAIVDDNVTDSALDDYGRCWWLDDLMILCECTYIKKI